MAEIGTVTGTLVGLERVPYGDKFDRTTGEKIRTAGELLMVWVSAPGGEGAPIQMKAWPEQFDAAAAIGFGVDVVATYALGAWKNDVQRTLREIEAVADTADAAAADPADAAAS